jgi:hypothetical protein
MTQWPLSSEVSTRQGQDWVARPMTYSMIWSAGHTDARLRGKLDQAATHNNAQNDCKSSGISDALS